MTSRSELDAFFNHLPAPDGVGRRRLGVVVGGSLSEGISVKLDPGHGGHDPGASAKSATEGFLENETRRMNLKVSVFYQFDYDEFIWGPLGQL